MDPHDELATTPIHDPLDDIRARLDDVMAGEPPPVDVRAYLLDPPPTPEEAERRERRRLLVRRGSIGACAIVAVLLLVPWPREASPPAASAASPEPAPAEPPEAALPQRVDVPPRRVRRHATPARPRPVDERPAARPSAAAATPVPPVRAPAPAAPPARTPAPARPAPADPAPTPTADAGVLVPVI